MKFGINTFTLKMIAIVAMLIDHVGAVLLPEYIVLRIIGRIAFPIFTYTLVEGFMYTHDVKKYMMRMGLLALISEVPYDLAFRGVPLEFGKQNVFFTLLLGLVMLYFLVNAPSQMSGFVFAFVILFISRYLRIDYGYKGLLMVFWYYQYRNNKFLKLLGIAFINVLLMGGYQIYAVLALIPIALHNGRQGPKSKGFFYGFYPVHLIVIYFINMIL